MSSQYILQTNILMQADDFAEAYNRCVQGINQPNNDGYTSYSVVNIPAIVNAAFACELYLKSIINKKVYTHNLLELFQLLNTDLQLSIEQEANCKLQKQNQDYYFKSCLERASNVFEDWRYIYEEKHSDGFMGCFVNEYLIFFDKFTQILKVLAHSN